MGILSFETPQDIARKKEREEEFQDAIRRLREVEAKQRIPVGRIQPVESPIGLPGGPGSPFEDVRIEQRLPPNLGLGPGSVGETRIPGQADLVPRTFPGFGAEFFERVGAAIDEPRKIIKREAIQPLVPEFDLGPVPTETLLTPFQEVMAGVARLGGVEGEQIPDVAETLGEVRITSGLVEEAASFVLDPLNLVFFIGPALKGAGGAARVANRIRQSGKIPPFVKNAQKLATRAATEEAGGIALGGGGRFGKLGVEETKELQALNSRFVRTGESGVGPLTEAETTRRLELIQAAGREAFESLTRSRSLKKPDLERAAIRGFGVADDLGEEGVGSFVLEDGRIINTGNVHGAIGDILPVGTFNKLSETAGRDADAFIDTFVQGSGALRAGLTQEGELFVAVSRLPSKAQRTTLLRFADEAERVVVEVETATGERILGRTLSGGKESLRGYLEDLARNPPEGLAAAAVQPARTRVTGTPEGEAFQAGRETLGLSRVEMESAVVKEFGTGNRVTGNGYLLQDGRLVNTGGEHAEIARVFPAHPDTSPDPLSNLTMGAVRRASEFGETTGAFRVGRFTEGGVYVEIRGIPTTQQRTTLTRLIRNEREPVTLSVINATGRERSVVASTVLETRRFFDDVVRNAPEGFDTAGIVSRETFPPFEPGGFSKERFAGKARALEGGPPPEAAPGGFGGGRGRPPTRTGGPRFPEGGPPEGVPPRREGAVARLTELIESAKPARVEQELILSEERAKRIAAAQDIFRGGKGTPEERFFRGKSQLGGDVKKADFEPVRPLLDEDDVQALIETAETFNFGPGKGFENVRATDALMALMGGDIPGNAELVLLEQVFGPGLPLAALKKGKFSTKAWRAFIELTNLPKTMLTMLDHSFPGRQGIKIAPSRPIEWADSAIAGTKAILSPKVAAQVERELLTDATPIAVQFGAVERTIPYSALKQRVKLFHAPFEETASFVARTDEYMSRWARRIPGLGRLVRASERAFNTSGNKLRSDVLKRILTKMNESGTTLKIDDVQALANLLNRATGRGTLGPIENLAPALNALQLAPRFKASHPQWVATLLNFKNPVAQKEAAREIVSFIGAGATLLGALELSGAITLEKDPRSADFGKAKIGKTRIDFWGGLQPLVRAVAMLSGSRKTSTGDIVGTGIGDVAFRTFRAGMSPVASFLTDVALGETFIGEELEPTPGVFGREAFNRLLPIAWQDIVDAVREEGVRGGLFSGLALVGIGVNTYETFAIERARRFEEETGTSFDPRNGGHWAILRNTDSLKDFAEAQSGQAKESQEFLNGKIEELRLPSMARALDQGNPVGPQFREAWEDFEGVRANSAARLAFGKDRDPIDDSAFAAWQAINREDFRDPVTFEIDYGAYRAEKDAAFDKMDIRIQEAMAIVGADDPLVAEWASSYVSSRLVRRELYGISKWEGLTPAQSQTLDSFSREVRNLAPIIAQQQGQRVTEADVAQFLADQRGQPGLADWFIGLQSSRERDDRWNPKYETFLERNRGFLQMFYPELYSQATLERIGVIEEAPTSGIPTVEPIQGIERLQPISR